MFNKDLRPKVEILERTVNDCVAMLGEQSKAFSSAMKAHGRFLEVLDSRIALIATILAEKDPAIRERFAAAPNFRDIADPEHPTSSNDGMKKQIQRIEDQMKTLLKKSKTKSRKKSA